MILACDRSYWPAEGPARPLRQSGSRGTRCPFRVVLKVSLGTWISDLRHGGHNHVASHPVAHLIQRRVSPVGLQRIKELTRADCPPREILGALRLAGDEILGPTITPVIAQDVRNARNCLQIRALGPYGPIQALLAELQGPDWFDRYESILLGQVSRLFLAPRRSRDLLRASPEVIIADSTYNVLHTRAATPTERPSSR